MKKRFLPVIFGIALLSASCVQRPEGIASDSKMASVLADIELAEAWLQASGSSFSDSQRRALEEYIISKHGMTRAEFDSTMVWYARNPDVYYDLCELSEKELVKKRRKIEGRSVVDLESSDIWPYSDMAMFSPLQESDGMIFSVPVAQTAKGDQLRFKMRFSTPADGEALFGVQYVDGLAEFISKSISNAHRLDLTLRTDTSRQVERVFGSLSIDGLKRTIWADSIRITVIPFDSTQYYHRSSQRKVSPPSRRVIQKPELTDSVAGDTLKMSRSAENDAELKNTPEDGVKQTPPQFRKSPSAPLQLRHNKAAARLKENQTAE